MARPGLGVLFVLCLAGAAQAQEQGRPQPLGNDPRRPVLQISRDLNVSSEQFVHCFEGVRPAAQGERPDSARVHGNKAMLLACLQKANPALSNDRLDAVMDRYRPGGREAQQPR